jgi:endonuclease YncB( thermonuclease family)
VVYVEFPAERETVYLHAQQKADENKKGLWSNPGLANQVRGFNLLWRESRKEREQED